MKVELRKVEGKAFGKSSGERKGSRKFGVISDDFGEWLVKWQRGEWKIVGTRLNTKVSTSLQLRAMSIAVDNGRFVDETERYSDFKKFMDRLVGIVGVDEFLKIVDWIRS